jgi:hypothetical protein
MLLVIGTEACGPRNIPILASLEKLLLIDTFRTMLLPGGTYDIALREIGCILAIHC